MFVNRGNKNYLNGFLSITFLLVSLFLVSAEFTGKVISGFGEGGFRNFSICFFICGLIFSFFYLKGRK